MKQSVLCLYCGKVFVEFTMHHTGYITVEKGTAVINKMTDERVTVDFYCDDCSGE